MDKTYLCPFCGAILNPGEKVILTVTKEEKRAMVLLSPVLGDYCAEIPRNFHPKKGEQIQFLCPVCQHDLTSPNNSDFAEISFRINNRSGKIAFSKIFGKQVTLRLDKDDEVSAYGKDAQEVDGLNFFGEGKIR